MRVCHKSMMHPLLFTETFLYLLSNEASFQKIFIDRNNFYVFIIVIHVLSIPFIQMNSHHILQQLRLWLEEKEVQDTIIIEIMLFITLSANFLTSIRRLCSFLTPFRTTMSEYNIFW